MQDHDDDYNSSMIDERVVADTVQRSFSYNTLLKQIV